MDSKYENYGKTSSSHPATFDDDYNDERTSAGNTEMTMDYFCREDMKMMLPKNLTEREKRKCFMVLERNETVIVDNELSEIENRKAVSNIY